MKKIATHSAIALAMIASGSAMADEFKSTSGPYAGANLIFMDADWGFADASFSAISGRLGTSINENFSGEVRVALGLDDDKIGGVNVGLDSMIGGYLRAGIPVANNLFPYAVIGFTRTELDVDPGSSDSDTDLSYGIGVDLALDRNISLNIEYMEYYDDSDVDISGISIGIATKI